MASLAGVRRRRRRRLPWAVRGGGKPRRGTRGHEDRATHRLGIGRRVAIAVPPGPTSKMLLFVELETVAFTESVTFYASCKVQTYELATAIQRRQPAGSARVCRCRCGGFWKKMFAFMGPAYLVSVGYMDPGNWATDLDGGAQFGYTLLWVIMMSNLMAILLQTLAARLGIVSGRDLAQACRDQLLARRQRSSSGSCARSRSRRATWPRSSARHRPEPALRPADDLGRLPDVGRRAAGALAAAAALPLRRGARGPADRRRSRVRSPSSSRWPGPISPASCRA